MNILLINYEYPPIGAGAAGATYNIARCLTTEGHQVTVVTSAFRTFKGYTIEDGVHIFRLPALRRTTHRSGIIEMLLFIITAFFHLKKICNKQQPEKAIIFFTIPCGLLSFSLRKMNIPYIISLRGGDVPFHQKELNMFHKILKPLRHKILKHAAHIVANSESFAKLSMQTDPFPVKVIPNGVDTNFFTPLQKNHPDGLFHILFAGRFQPEKNIILLLREIAALKAYLQTSKVKQGFILHLVGDGPLKVQIMSEAADLGLTGEIKFHGWLNKEALREMYCSCHCLVNPSTGEGMPNAVLEAMACGLPVIASNVRGNDAVVRHDETGLLFELEQPDSLVASLLAILHNQGLREKLKRGAISNTLLKFSWKNTTEKYLDLLNK